MSNKLPKKVDWSSLSEGERENVLRRPAIRSAKDGYSHTQQTQVSEILNLVRSKGDEALRELTEKYDGIKVESFRVSRQEIQESYEQVQVNDIQAIQEAIRRVTLFHKAQLPKPIDLETSEGVRCERKHFPIDRVGLYVPAGTAPLPSTAVMLGAPSKVAGCRLRVLITPPGKNGKVNPVTLVAADLLGITEIYKGGGAQAIAALAYGTQTIPKVDKIFGPGNSWVTEAKLQVSQDPMGAACDLPAGPSEVMVVADNRANPAFVAADLLAQAEHGPDSQVILLSDSERMLDEVCRNLQVQLATLPRKSIAEQSLERSALIRVENLEDAIPICNRYAPEHLILQVTQPRDYMRGITCAGSVFLGSWTPESAGDYASGTNHVLPTYGFARAYGGLTTESFMRSMTIQELTPEGLKDLGPTIERLALLEDLHAHQRAVRVRMEAFQL